MFYCTQLMGFYFQYILIDMNQFSPEDTDNVITFHLSTKSGKSPPFCLQERAESPS